LFPKELILPFFGVGKMPEDKYFKIVAYQLNAETCPNLNFNKLATCNIHEKRPLTCKSFPFLCVGSPFEMLGPYRLQLIVSKECSFVQKSDAGNASEIEAPNEKKAAEQMVLKISIRKGAQWYYDLNRKEWIPIGEIEY